jgi:hypothetical protein
MLGPHKATQNGRVDVQFWQDMEHPAVGVRRLDKKAMGVNEPASVFSFSDCVFHRRPPAAQFCGVHFYSSGDGILSWRIGDG